MGGAFFEELCHFEVMRRNAMHERLTIWHRRHGRPGRWYDDRARVLHNRCHEDVALARAEVQHRVNRLHRLRNRIAHHEPIHREDLTGMRHDLVQVVGWIDPDAATWLTTTCDGLPWLLAHRP